MASLESARGDAVRLKQTVDLSSCQIRGGGSSSKLVFCETKTDSRRDSTVRNWEGPPRLRQEFDRAGNGRIIFVVHAPGNTIGLAE